MTITQKLEHARKYGYPVKIDWESGNTRSGVIRSLSKTSVSINGSIPYSADCITSVEPISGDTPSEIAEIDSDEEWIASWGGGDYWMVNARDRSKGVLLRLIADCTKEHDAKATAALPELVRQRHTLLEASKALVERPAGLKYVSPGGVRDIDVHCRTLSEIVAVIEKNPLIRLTDPE